MRQEASLRWDLSQWTRRGKTLLGTSLGWGAAASDTHVRRPRPRVTLIRGRRFSRSLHSGRDQISAAMTMAVIVMVITLSMTVMPEIVVIQ